MWRANVWIVCWIHFLKWAQIRIRFTKFEQITIRVRVWTSRLRSFFYFLHYLMTKVKYSIKVSILLIYVSKENSKRFLGKNKVASRPFSRVGSGSGLDLDLDPSGSWFEERFEKNCEIGLSANIFTSLSFYLYSNRPTKWFVCLPSRQF